MTTHLAVPVTSATVGDTGRAGLWGPSCHRTMPEASFRHSVRSFDFLALTGSAWRVSRGRGSATD